MIFFFDGETVGHPPNCKAALEKSIFQHPLEVSGSEMNVISFAFYKEYVRPLDQDEVFEIPQFYVHRVQDHKELHQMVSYLS